MAVTIAEYLGQRTDDDNSMIQPVKPNSGAMCPFMNGPCLKLAKKTNPSKPVCSVRTLEGVLWIVCPVRLCATKKKLKLSDYQKSVLHEIAKHIYGEEISRSEVLVKREEKLPVTGKSYYHADYIMLNSITSGIDQQKIVLEMQGGGETGSTGEITRHIEEWENLKTPTNAFLRKQTKAGLVVTNAWRRQQEQFIIKGNIAMQTGGKIVFCVGSLLYDYLYERIKDAPLSDLKNHNWTMALVAFCEDTAPDTTSHTSTNSVRLKIDRKRTIFTQYINFVQALLQQGQPCPEMFKGVFTSLDDREIEIT